eukprot:1203648-Rhodomonas_salina.3
MLSVPSQSRDRVKNAAAQDKTSNSHPTTHEKAIRHSRSPWDAVVMLMILKLDFRFPFSMRATLGPLSPHGGGAVGRCILSLAWQKVLTQHFTQLFLREAPASKEFLVRYRILLGVHRLARISPSNLHKDTHTEPIASTGPMSRLTMSRTGRAGTKSVAPRTPTTKIRGEPRLTRLPAFPVSAHQLSD